VRTRPDEVWYDLQYGTVSPMKSTVSESSIVVAAEDQVSSDLGGEVAILDLKAGVYYGLDEVGARIWSLIEKPRRVGEIRDVLVDEYDVAPDRCERDLLALLQKLADAELIEVDDGAPA
jgi:hypothetical protein